MSPGRQKRRCRDDGGRHGSTGRKGKRPGGGDDPDRLTDHARERVEEAKRRQPWQRSGRGHRICRKEISPLKMR